MWLSFVLAMCMEPSLQVVPAAGAVPEGAVLWATPTAVAFAVEDARGQSLAVHSTKRDGAVEFTVDAPAGTEFYVRDPATKAKPLGPWKVGAKFAPATHTPPLINPAQENDVDGCPSYKAWTLTSDASAPMYKLELSGAAMTRTTWSTELYVGHAGCRPETWSWDGTPVNVRMRMHFIDGSASAWSNTLTLAPPTAPLIDRGLRLLYRLL